MAALGQRATQLAMVVNFAVECDPYRAVFIRHGLMTAPEIYDGKPSMSKTHRVAHPSTGIIRTSVCESVTHPD